MNDKKVDTSLDTARSVVREESINHTSSSEVRNLSLQILNLGFENQFEEDREKIRRTIDELISSVAAQSMDKNED